MKLNKFLLSLLIVPALTFMSCNDYEDVEVVSPQADENALGANFNAATTPVVVNPTTDKFELTLNRLNVKESVTVPVTVVSCDAVTGGAKFCEQPTVFIFAAGEAQATLELKLDPKCNFQETYAMTLTIGTEKDHPYAAGTTTTKVSVIRDYKWTSLGKSVVLEEGWYGRGMLSTMQWAEDYKDDNKRILCRVSALYSGAQIAAEVPLDKDGAGKPIPPNPPYKPMTAKGLQFLLDERYDRVEKFANDSYNPDAINTGILQNEKTGNYYFMKITDIAKEGTTYNFKYDIFYKEGDEDKSKLTGVTATFDYDFKTPIEKLLEQKRGV